GFVAKAKEKDPLRVVEGGAGLDGSHFARGKGQGVGQGHAEARLDHYFHRSYVFRGIRARLGKRALQGLVNSQEIDLCITDRDGVRRQEGEKCGIRLSFGPDIKKRAGRCVAENAALQAGPRAFEGEMAGENVDGIEFEGFEHTARLRHLSTRVEGEFL